MQRLRSALHLVTGLSEDSRTGYRRTVHCRPEAWRCSVCGGGLISGPKGAPLIHVHTHASRCVGRPAGWAVRYVGLSAHLSRVWASLWGNRPRLVRAQPRLSYDRSSAGDTRVETLDGVRLPK